MDQKQRRPIHYAAACEGKGPLEFLLKRYVHDCSNHLLALRGGSCACLTLKVLVTTIDAQWEGMGDVGSPRYEPALLPPCPTIRVLSYSN